MIYSDGGGGSDGDNDIGGSRSIYGDWQCVDVRNWLQ